VATRPQEQPTPERFFNALNAHQQTAAMKAAIELDVFTAIAEGNATAASIAARCEAAERGVRILCDYLAILGFLKKENSQYSLAPDASLFLNRTSPAYVGTAMKFMLAPRICEAHEQLTEAVRRGGTAVGAGTTEPENADWVEFARSMMPLMSMPSQIIAAELRKGGEVRKVLDIAAGHGLYGIAVARQNPMAHIYAADWKNVLAVAQENAQGAGVADRYHLIPGDAFATQLGTGYDLALITNFLHHFDALTCTSFLRKVHDALKPGGRAAIAEFVPNPDRISPPTAAAFSMMMLATTPSGDAYTFAELEKMAKDAGFARVEMAPAELGINKLVIAYR
jgi:2-polyprenyl-3-methyl-5-hydroxy-6-metoxy-1,4-benzoquinol methylase